jgi:C1A family cysteine protease
MQRQYIASNKLQSRGQKRKEQFKATKTEEMVAVKVPINNSNAPNNVVKPLPTPPQPKPIAQFSLEKYISFPVYDQGQLGSCTANAFCAAFRIRSTVQKKFTGFIPSRLFFYYNERQIEGTTREDAGADVIDGELFVQQQGICSEALWPYIIPKFAVQPPPTCYAQAKQYCIKTFLTLLQEGPALVQAMKQQLLANEPLLIAVALYDSFESDSTAKTGIVSMPNKANESCLGGHEMCVIGFDDAKQQFLVLNSWGPRWGSRGRCYMPYAYFQDPNLCFEVSFFSL